MMRYLFIWCGLITLQVNLAARDFNILTYGARPDGVTLNTEQIQAAIDAAHLDGGGRVIVPKGRFLTGSIIIKSHVELHLQQDAVLLGSTNPAHYIKLNRWVAFVLADGQSNISITGKGEINGQGRQVALKIDSLFYIGQLDSALYTFPEMRPKWYLRPQVIEFVDCKKVTVKNVTLTNSACWVMTHDRCEYVIIDSVRVDSDAYWNNDGIDIQDCKHVRITNCVINSSDDGICLKSQSRDHWCEDIYVANCTVRSSASAVKFGTVSFGGFKNVVIEHIKVYDTFRSAIAIECVDGGFLEDVLVQHIDAVNTGNAIFIRLGKRWIKDVAGTLRNVTIRDVKVDVAFGRPDGAYDVRGPDLPFFHNIFPSSITGIPGHRVENVILENIDIHYPGRGNEGLANMPLWRLNQVPERIADYPEFSMFGELPAWGFYVRHIDGLTMKNIRLHIEAPDYRPACVFDDVHELNIMGMEINGDRKPHQIVLYKTESAQINEGLTVLKM